MVQQVVTRIQALFAWWMRDIRGRKSLIGKLASLGIGMFVLCCVCSFGLAAVRSTGQAVGLVATNTPTLVPTNTPQPTSTPEATETPQPSATPAPTNTAVPSPTSEPATPEPTAAPTTAAGISTTDRLQVVTMGQHLGTLGSALGEIGTLAKNYENTDSWKVDMAVQIVQVRQAHQAILGMQVSPSLSALRAAVLNATADCNAAMDALVAGIDKNSGTELTAASELMLSCGNKIGPAKAELEALK